MLLKFLVDFGIKRELEFHPHITFIFLLQSDPRVLTPLSCSRKKLNLSELLGSGSNMNENKNECQP